MVTMSIRTLTPQGHGCANGVAIGTATAHPRGMNSRFFEVQEAIGRVDGQHAARYVHVGDERLDERHHGLAPVRRLDHQDVLARVQHVVHGADLRAVDRADGQADKVSVAELVRVLGRCDRGGVHCQPGTAELGGGVPVADALEPDEELAGVPLAARHGERADLGRVGVQPRARREPQFGLVGADTDHNVTANPVRTADPADGYLHGNYLTSPVSSRSMRTCLFPAREPITVRSARAVRPPRPMNLPRSSGWTRTSSTLPRRSIRLTTRTSSG